jgi:hypothetical protein
MNSIFRPATDIFGASSGAIAHDPLCPASSIVSFVARISRPVFDRCSHSSRVGRPVPLRRHRSPINDE